MGARDKAKSKRGGNRGGGSRAGAQSAEDIERRNARVEEFDERRAQRRQDAADEENGTKDTEEKMEGMSLKDGGGEKKADEDAPMTRKQRELAEKERKAAEYRRRHELGLTEEYKKDMTKLAEVRARREIADARAKMEKEAAESIEKDRLEKAAALGAFDEDSDDDKKKKKKGSKKVEIPKLDKISIKKMKPAQMKEALKERGLEIQGNAKALTDRLLKHEASR